MRAIAQWFLGRCSALAERLRSLEERRFIYRDYEATIPPTVTYGITKRMRDIHRIFDELERAARKWQMEDSLPRTTPKPR
jgi:DNA-binding HxlR family transcriptional regulator